MRRARLSPPWVDDRVSDQFRPTRPRRRELCPRSCIAPSQTLFPCSDPGIFPECKNGFEGRLDDAVPRSLARRIPERGILTASMSSEYFTALTLIAC